MRVNKKTVVDIASGKIVSCETSHYYCRPALAKSSGSTQTTNQSLPAWLKPYAKDFIEAYAGQVWDPETGEMMPYPEDLQMQVAGFSPEQETAFQNIANMFGAGQGLAGMGALNTMSTLGGAYLHPESNPYLNATYGAAARRMTDAYSTATAPGIMAAAQRAGQFGGSAMDETLALSRYDLGENLGNLATSIYGGNYASERDRMLQTLGMVPQSISSLYAPAQYLAGVGAQRQEQQQQEFDTAYSNLANQVEWPFNLLSGFGAALGQAAGGGGTSTTVASGSQPGAFGSVICTELHRQGLMDDKTYAADTQFGMTLPREVVRGYHLWAVPLAQAMRKSPILTRLVAPLALQWAKTMRAIVDSQPENETLLGRFMLKIGIPICGWLGKRRREVRWASQ